MTDVLERPPIWDARGMGAGYGSTEGVIKEIDLVIKPGERVALLGAASSGRSMLLRVFAGLRPVRQGTLTVMGKTLDQLPYWADWDQIMPQALRLKMGVCLESEGLLNNVTVREGLELLFRFKYGDHNGKLRAGASKVVQSTCEKLGLGQAADKRPVLLSAAERRIAGIARAFLSKPHVVVLENPSQSVGDLYRDRLWKALEHICESPERTVLISTDDWAVASHFCPRWVVVEEGRIIYDGTPEAFLKSGNVLIDQLRDLRKIHAAYEKLLEKTA